MMAVCIIMNQLKVNVMKRLSIMLLCLFSIVNISSAVDRGRLSIYFPDSISGSVVLEEWKMGAWAWERTVIDSAGIVNHKYVFDYQRKLDDVSNIVALNVYSGVKKYKMVFKNPYMGISRADMRLDNSDIVVRVDEVSGNRIVGIMMGSPENDFQFAHCAFTTAPIEGYRWHTPYFLDAKRHHIVDFDIIRKYPSNMELLNWVWQYRDYYSTDSLRLAFGLFDDNVRQTKSGRELQAFMNPKVSNKDFWKKEFCFYDTLGKAHDFSDVMNGKRVGLIIFWASWCGPCRVEMPHLVKLYDKYKDKVAFVSLSLDEKKQNWQKAVEQLSVPWPSLASFSDNKNTKPILEIFPVLEVPSFLLVDSDGNILQDALTGSERRKSVEQCILNCLE